ncbi:MAG: hypothetical protein FRX49_04258 [Trebouxia sp. A1-2]|nr:MAG: hypothetical protein FRX49_04258 [Trebouxia sp. A1-2]
MSVMSSLFRQQRSKAVILTRWLKHLSQIMDAPSKPAAAAAAKAIGTMSTATKSISLVFSHLTSSVKMASRQSTAVS